MNPAPQPSRRANRRTPQASRGFSLLELLLVMAVIGIVLGAGLGAFSALDLESERAPERVRAVLRAAQSEAAAYGWPANVTLIEAPDKDPALVLRSARPVGTWQFEDPALVEAARGQRVRNPRDIDPVWQGAQRIDDGYLGQGLSFRGGARDATVSIDLSGDSLFDPGEGFGLSLRVLMNDVQASGRLLDLGGSCGLELRAGGLLLAWITPEILNAVGRRQRGGRVQLTTGEAVLPLDRWVEIRLGYDRMELRLSVDGVPVAALDLDKRVASPTGPLVLGGAPAAAALACDVLSLAVYGASEPIPLGIEFAWPADAPKLLRFTGDGGLDPRRHPAPVRLDLLGAEGFVETLTIGRLGGLSVEEARLAPLLEEGSQ